MSGPRRTAVTGIGVVAPGGVNRKEFWTLLTDGRTATRRLSFFDPTQFRSQVAAECDFDPAAAGLTAREIARNDRFAQFALAAALEAVEDSGLDLRGGGDGSGDGGDGSGDGPIVGVSIGSAVGATTRLENEYVEVSDSGRDWEVDPRYASSFLYHAMVPSCLATELACRFGAHGPAFVVSTGCTSGIDAVGYGHQLIVDGEADIVIAGASDAPISPISMASFDAIRATTARNDDPEHASRPFDASRDGFVMGEGCAVLILEELTAARSRGAHIYCEVGGYASRSNAFHMTGLRPDGVEMAEAIRVAMDAARVGADDIDYINAHGSGTKQNDRHETAAFKRSLGQRAYDIPVSSIKSMIGHSLGAIGSIEIAACALAIENDVIPPTANWTTRDPECDLDYVPNIARDHTVDVALSVGSGFGGFQSAIVLAAPTR
ncbi:beta-ketoacyl-[acyl-carrier-protein] synthase family protein [Frankia sp. B2]|uniref:beta-ketoacyl-[acyl-carrier-protein] synthase family protein n=1 Tax=unclassified Frankia TaxID=2632575 RepID=UPI0003CFFB33|nr:MULTISPECIES: beta-ketoacyl-[acyl-carrier-protein] synthase family protein [unclassified Frankia]ETA02507.1 3-oxoacyl-(acyl-carrier-protein) synthase [Frankia sp. CcI6]KDA43167.1 3-oxoacyl-(acyl-carrier-protein) synthase [Frankia sp. BMG5.23]OHV48573.1 beta-ACP synthase [Frankia sp. CgIS1]ORT54083.1 beta-ACP synthase [Frankia sp. KB5]TFE33750.1 beta-ketoacyl-[acyl-carrier-protein] synthase family protein [Frankia sp. B2]